MKDVPCDIMDTNHVSSYCFLLVVGSMDWKELLGL